MYLGMFKLKGNTLQPPSAQKGCSLAGLNHRAEEEENLGGLSSCLCNKSRGAHEGFLSLHVAQGGAGMATGHLNHRGTCFPDGGW